MAPLLDESHYSPGALLGSPSSFAKRKPQKQVSFSIMSDLYLVPHANDMKKKEREAVWMTKDDFRRIEIENMNTLVEMVNGHFPNKNKTYFRGLETLMPEARGKRKQRRSFVVSNILKEQQKRNELRPQWLEDFYCSYTSKSAEAAYRKGIWDAAESNRRTVTKHKTEVWI